MVTEDELKSLLQSHGWYLSMVTKFHNRFAYAKKRENETVTTRYLKSESKLHELTPEEVLKRIQS